jgi:hypothetical protein
MIVASFALGDDANSLLLLSILLLLDEICYGLVALAVVVESWS